MKKLISILALLCLSFIVKAQDFGVWELAHPRDPNNRSNIAQSLSRLVAKRQLLPWAKTVERQMYAAQPHGYVGINNIDAISPLITGPVPADIAQRANALTAALQQNPVLKKFRFKAPAAKDVATMSEEHLRYILQFLKAPVYVNQADARCTPTGIEAYKHYIVRVTLKPNKELSPVHLIFNCYAQEMYVSYPWLEVPGVGFERLNGPVK